GLLDELPGQLRLGVEGRVCAAPGQAARGPRGFAPSATWHVAATIRPVAGHGPPPPRRWRPAPACPDTSRRPARGATRAWDRPSPRRGAPRPPAAPARDMPATAAAGAGCARWRPRARGAGTAAAPAGWHWERWPPVPPASWWARAAARGPMRYW